VGAWGSGSFENDTACDWAYGLEKESDLRYVERALERVESSDGNLDADVAQEAIAAAEVAARLLGRGGERSSYTATVDDWVAAHPIEPPRELIQRAIAVLRRILTPPSELRELWEESDLEGWEAAIHDLLERLSP
jgi:hypothetical protein